MECQHCGEHIVTRCMYYARAGFLWDCVCMHCRDRFKLADWTESCRPLGESNAIDQTEQRRRGDCERA